MVADRVHEIECPGCGVVLPLGSSRVPGPSGVSTTFDESYVDEHMKMHAECDCLWVDKVRQHVPDCKVHN